MEPVVSIAQGTLRGASSDGIVSFKGVPYAAAPQGVNRFAAPAPAPSWDGVRDAVRYGSTAPKAPYPQPIDKLLQEPIIPGAEYLNLNVWTPDVSGRLPVLVWIHGGAFVNGSGAVDVYGGSAFARDGVVCVTINYRLGAEGFLLLDGAPANRGLLDQVAALTWVRDNIAAFGGDPDAVTIAGESAGAMSVGCLLSMPAAAGLFRRAIAQSGAAQHVMSVETARKVTAALAEQLGIAATRDGFASVSAEALVAAQTALSARIAMEPSPLLWGEIATDSMAFEPCVDGTVLTARPLDRLAAGACADVDVLIGTNSDEMTLFVVPNGLVDVISSDVLRMGLTAFGLDIDATVAAYGAVLPQASPGELFAAIVRDRSFWIPAIRVAEARLTHGADTFVYEFGWRSPQLGGRLGATHALEIAFVFDNLGESEGHPLTGAQPPQELADVMHRAWVAFVASGDPGWQAYGADRQVMQFDVSSGVVADPARELREIWDGVR